MGMAVKTGMILLTVWLALQICLACTMCWFQYDPGYGVYLMVHSVLPFIVLLMHFCKNTASMRWALFCTYTVSVVIGILAGVIGPFISDGAFWNFRCMEQSVNPSIGLYELTSDCKLLNWMMVVEVVVRLPFQLMIIFGMHRYTAEKSQEEALKT